MERKTERKKKEEKREKESKKERERRKKKREKRKEKRASWTLLVDMSHDRVLVSRQCHRVPSITATVSVVAARGGRISTARSMRPSFTIERADPRPRGRS